MSLAFRLAIQAPIPRSLSLSFRVQNYRTLTFSTLSWMDSWSRPSKSQAAPPPLYLTQPDVKYCHTCGRVISDRKSHKSASTPAKYCSAKCRSRKPREMDSEIESVFAALLDGEQNIDGEAIPDQVLSILIKSKAKGEQRVIVPCSAVEVLVYGTRRNLSKASGRRNTSTSRVKEADSGDTWTSVDMEDDEVNGQIGHENEQAKREIESKEALSRRTEGQRLADEKECIKRAARRGCVFGLAVQAGDQETKKMCEAVMNGKVVEPSFAKGDWGIRWRE